MGVGSDRSGCNDEETGAHDEKRTDDEGIAVNGPKESNGSEKEKTQRKSKNTKTR